MTSNPATEPRGHNPRVNPEYNPNVVTVTMTRQQVLTLVNLLAGAIKRRRRQAAKKPWSPEMGASDVSANYIQRMTELHDYLQANAGTPRTPERNDT